MIVLDASAAISIFLNVGPEARRIRERIARPDETLHVPHLFDVEVLHVLRRHSLNGTISDERERIALQRLSATRLTRYSHASFVWRIWELRHNLSAYDAAYVALAEVLAAPLLTTDRRLAQASGIRAAVELY